jgi:hypothetical protein
VAGNCQQANDCIGCPESERVEKMKWIYYISSDIPCCKIEGASEPNRQEENQCEVIEDQNGEV